MTGFRICSRERGGEMLQEGYKLHWINSTDREIILATIDSFARGALYWRDLARKEEARAAKLSWSTQDRYYVGREHGEMEAAAMLAEQYGIATSCTYRREAHLANFRAQQAKLKLSDESAKSQSQTVAA